MGDCWRSWCVWPVKSSGVAVTFFMIGFLGLWFLFNIYYGVRQYQKLIKWKKQLNNFSTTLNAEYAFLEACERDLSHREKVWNDLKDKIEKDSKWKLKN